MRLSTEDREEISQLREEVRKLRGELREARAERDEARDKAKLEGQITDLKTELTDLQIAKAKVEEDNARERREIEHKVGLERTRQEQELVLAKREAEVGVREANLDADRARFEEQMSFTTRRFEQEALATKELMSEILKRLPTVSVEKAIDLRIPAHANGNGDGSPASDD